MTRGRTADDAEPPAPLTEPAGVATTPGAVAAAAQLACLLEVSAAKPGNVSPAHHFANARYEDFLASSVAIGPPMAAAGDRSLGATVRAGVEAVTAWARSNTNLGIVLLLAPIARAALVHPRARTPLHAPLHASLREAVRAVLTATTVDDARDVYAAIRLAAPGGLGRAAAEDVEQDPTVTLGAAMGLAAERDGVAREYSTAFAATFETGVPALERARGDGLGWDDAVVEAFLTLLAAAPDTHVARRAGVGIAAEVSRGARDVLAAGGVRSRTGRRALAAFDAELRDPRNLRNPGTTADITAAAIFVVLVDGGWHLPTDGGVHAESR